jgi:hypothetical protein
LEVYASNVVRIHAFHDGQLLDRGDDIRLADEALLTVLLVPGVYAEVHGPAQVRIDSMLLRKDGNETADVVTDRSARLRLTEGVIVCSVGRSPAGLTIGTPAGDFALKQERVEFCHFVSRVL